MTILNDSDWSVLEDAARLAQMPTERVTLLRQQLRRDLPRPGSPWTLLVGRPDAGIELVLARHFDPKVADALKAVGERPLVIGRDPDRIRPTLGSWPVHRSDLPAEGQIVALRTARPPSPEILGQLRSLGTFDQLVLVTRLAGPLHEQERALALALNPLAAMVRVLIVGLGSEEPTDNDLAEVVAYAQVQMRQAGYDDTRRNGTDVWFASGPTRPHTLPGLNSLFVVDPAQVASARIGGERTAVRTLLVELSSKLETRTAPAGIPITDAEKTRLIQEFQGYVADLEREVRKVFVDPNRCTSIVLRAFAVDSFQGWGAYTSPEGFWLKYVERLRLGSHAEMMEQVRQAATLLEVVPAPRLPSQSAPPNSPWLERALMEAKRAGVGLVAGVLANTGVHAFLIDAPRSGDVSSAASPSSMFVRWIGYSGFGIASLLGYGLGRSFFREPSPPRPAEAASGPSSAVTGWQPFAQRLIAWLTVHLNTEPHTPREKIQILLQRLNAEEKLP